MEVSTVKQAPQSVFLNSSFAQGASSTSNQLSFTFNTPLTKEPDDLVYIALTQFMSFNTFANISQVQKNNVLKVVNVMYNAVTGQRQNYEKRFEIPDDRYDVTSLGEYLNSICHYQVEVKGANWTSSSTKSFLYLGFGFNGKNHDTAILPIQSFTISATDGQVSLNSAVTSFSNAYTKTYTSGGSITNDPYVYEGLYLLYDEETEGFMKASGFSTKFVKIPNIGNGYQGFGYNFPLYKAPTVQTRVTSPFPINLAGPFLLYMTIDSLGNNSRCNDPTMDNFNIISTIPVDVFYGQCISFSPSNTTYQLLDDLNTSNFSITFYDQDRRLVDFRGGHWTACLHFITKTLASSDRINRETANNSIGYYPALDQSRALVQQKKRKQNPYGGVRHTQGLLPEGYK